MAYNNLTSRTDAASLIPEEVSRDMIRRATEDSFVLQQFRKVPVSRGQVRFPILSALPVAYFVDGDTGLKQTTEVNWDNKYLYIEEIAAIMPVPDNVIADVELNLWDEAMPYLTEAFGRTLDAAVMFGTNAPSSWPTNIVAAAVSAANTVTGGTAAAAAGGVLGDFDSALGKLDADGFDADGVAASTAYRANLRAARDTTGQKLDAGRVAPDLKMIDGMPVTYPLRGLWPTGGSTGTNARAVVADFSQFILGVRQDISMKVLTESVITDNASPPAILYNLAQQDMTALRLTFRIGWQVANLLNHDQPTESNRYPAAVIRY